MTKLVYSNVILEILDFTWHFSCYLKSFFWKA